MRPPPNHLQQDVLLGGGVGGKQMAGIYPASTLPHTQDWLSENGSSICDDWDIRVSVSMLMPGARSAMWDWWFAWHGSDSLGSKLWHPRGHVHTV